MAWTLPPWITAEWRFLTYLNYRVAPEALEPFLPTGLKLDRYDGDSFVSVVGARCLNPRWRGVRVLSPEGFSRIRLQTYVRSDKQKGVFPLAEIYSLSALATLRSASSLWGAKFFPIQTEIAFSPTETVSEGNVRFHWSPEASLGIETEGPPSPVELWPDEAFFIDRYRSYGGSGAKLSVIASERPGWFDWTTKRARLTAAAAQALAGERAHWLEGEPYSSFLVKGGPVSFRRVRC